MDILFQFLKDIRKSKESLVRKDPLSPEVDEVQSKIESLQEQIRILRKSLPIQSVRRDLDAHYKEYLSEFSGVVSRNGGAGRCLVDTMPVPIAQDSGSHTYQLPPSFAPMYSVDLLKQALEQVLRASQENGNKVQSCGLVGISTFHCGQLLFTQTRHDAEATISNQSVSLLMAYMASYRTKMSHIAALCHATPNSNTTATPTGVKSPSTDPKLGFGNLALSFGPIMDEPVASSIDKYVGDRPQNEFKQRGKFLSSPPSFMMSATNPTYNIRYDDRKQDIWAPMVHLLPLNLSTTDERNIEKTHMVMFDFLEFSFLLFLKLPLARNQSPSELLECQRLFMKLEEELSEAILLTLHVDIDDSSKGERSMEWTNGPGQDIILLERSRYRLVLFQDPATNPSWSRRDSSKKKGVDRKRQQQQQRRFLWLGPRLKDRKSSQPLNYGSIALEWSALGLDCRHLLASRLPLDVCLAFDDMVNEITRRREIRKQQSVGQEAMNGSIEFCTCMPYGWIYAYATDDNEIYAFFDNSIYVTVTDVQSAALRIKETFTST
jgi:hypothetical protein